MDLTNLQHLDLSPEDIQELNRPFTAKEAMEGVRLGVASAISEMGLMPSEFEQYLKLGSITINPMDWLHSTFEGAKDISLLGIGAGAAAGAYSGYARSKINQMLDGNGDPQVVELRKKIDAYHALNQDLKRSKAVTQGPTQPIASSPPA